MMLGKDKPSSVSTSSDSRAVPVPKVSSEPARKQQVVNPITVRKEPARKTSSSDGSTQKAMTNIPTVKKLSTTTSMKAREALPNEVEALINYKGQVLTGAGGVAELTETQAQRTVLLGGDDVSRNILVISKSHYMDHETSSARSIMRRAGLSWSRELLVDLDVIRKIYDKSFSSGALVSKDAGNMQREFINILNRAAKVKASDIHIIVNRFEAVIRMRSDGVMRKVSEMPASAASELCQAAFAMADASDPAYSVMDYQGARVTESSLKGMRFPPGVQAVRLQFNPLPGGGRYMVARILYSQKIGSTADVDELGYAANQIEQIRLMRRRPYGMVIISGPTGSGKSTTLQRSLTALMRERPDKNIVTIEDPPEYVIEGAAQLPVTNARTSEDRSEKFSQAISASLRSDPDVIMIGEIRDLASSHLAFEAAMTGHGVWASLHANDAASILDRLRDFGVEDFKLCDATLISGLVGQRLLRKSTPNHEVNFEEGVSLGLISKGTAELIRKIASPYLENIRFAGTHKFPESPDQAFSGRSVVAEVIFPDQEFLDLMKVNRKKEAVNYWLEHLDGMTMLEHGFSKVCSGLLDIRELEDNIGQISKINPDRIPTIMKMVNG